MEHDPAYHERVGMLVYRREGEKHVTYCYLSRNKLRY